MKGAYCNHQVIELMGEKLTRDLSFKKEKEGLISNLEMERGLKEIVREDPEKREVVAILSLKCSKEDEIFIASGALPEYSGISCPSCGPEAMHKAYEREK